MFKFWGSQEQEQARPQDVNPAQSWYPPSLVTSATPTSSSSSSHSLQRPTERTLSPSPAEAAAIITVLKDKSADDLRKLLSDKDAYHQFLLSLDQVKIQNNIRDALCKETLQLASLAALFVPGASLTCATFSNGISSTSAEKIRIIFRISTA